MRTCTPCEMASVAYPFLVMGIILYRRGEFTYALRADFKKQEFKKIPSDTFSYPSDSILRVWSLITDTKPSYAILLKESLTINNTTNEKSDF